MTELRLEGVSFEYPGGVRALEGVDLVVKSGESLALVGANGSGKTTLLRHLDGLLRPTSGRVLHDGEEIGSRPGATSSDDIWQRVLWTINEFVIPNGYEIRPEHVIIPGALTGLHPGKPGNYVIDYAGLGKIEFEVR